MLSEIVGQFARVLEEGVGLDVDDFELGRVSGAGKRQIHDRSCDSKRTHDPTLTLRNITFVKKPRPAISGAGGT